MRNITYTAVGSDSSGRVVSSCGEVIAFCFSFHSARMVADALNLWEPMQAEEDHMLIEAPASEREEGGKG